MGEGPASWKPSDAIQPPRGRSGAVVLVRGAGGQSLACRAGAEGRTLETMCGVCVEAVPAGDEREPQASAQAGQQRWDRPSGNPVPGLSG